MSTHQKMMIFFEKTMKTHFKAIILSLYPNPPAPPTPINTPH